jgi:hypothetical protein
MAIEEELVVLKEKVNELSARIQEVSGQAKPRDNWDKIAIITQVLSSVILGALGILFTFWIAQMQNNVATLQVKVTNAQVDIARQQRTAEYFRALVEAEPQRVGSLINGVELVMPENALAIAQFYARHGTSDEARISALDLLGRLAEKNGLADERDKARLTLEEISNNNQDTKIGDHARLALGKPVKAVRIRLSNIDDRASISVNGKEELVRELGSWPWVDISDKLSAGKDNRIVFKLINGEFGGWSGRFEIASTWHSYDSGLLADDKCPCNTTVMEIHVLVRLDADRKVVDLQKFKVQYYGSTKPSG